VGRVLRPTALFSLYLFRSPFPNYFPLLHIPQFLYGFPGGFGLGQGVCAMDGLVVEANVGNVEEKARCSNALATEKNSRNEFCTQGSRVSDCYNRSHVRSVL
jgi:hypothetical protein